MKSTCQLQISPREANVDRDGWPTASWLLDLSRLVEAIGYAMDLDDPQRRRVMAIAGALRAGAEAREAYPVGVSVPVDVERRRMLDDAANAADGIVLIIPTLRYSSESAEEYMRVRGWQR